MALCTHFFARIIGFCSRLTVRHLTSASRSVHLDLTCASLSLHANLILTSHFLGSSVARWRPGSLQIDVPHVELMVSSKMDCAEFREMLLPMLEEEERASNPTVVRERQPLLPDTHRFAERLLASCSPFTRCWLTLCPSWLF